ncbi:MAG: serine--tRNA ligase [Candidatus Omnitrophica bacterium]|nr:serine--tRNA ligase [Candidatus Omnitrophota bacterium]
MLDLRFIRENVLRVREGLAAKNAVGRLDELLALDEKRRELIVKIDELKAKKNAANEEITSLLKQKQDPKDKIASMKVIASQVDALEPEQKAIDEKIHEILMFIPNLPHPSIPVGGPDKNRVVRSWGDLRKFDFKPKDHVALAEAHDIVDFKRATKISGANFLLYKGAGALLERALINFMLDLHTREHGYVEVFPPVLVNAASMTGTGQLPKMKDDMYHLAEDDLYLIPTAEVPVTNIYRDEILEEAQLPIFHTAYSTCFRREAGSYGKDTRGLMRVHQFNKVELVKFVKPETSYEEHETLVANAEKVFQLLKIPYRILELASGDISFSAAKCYDIEVYAPGLDKWLEASSCSNFEDFQARRANIRYKGKDMKKPAFVHTLNGSGVATPRTMVAILETYQRADGGIDIPEVLWPYTGGLKAITARV